MHVIAINRFYSPDHSATAQLLTDLAEHLAGQGNAVTVITSRLGYDGEGRLPARERLNGVEVRRIWTTHFGRARLAGRAIDYLTFYLSACVALMSAGRRGDTLIAKTDPPLISVVAGLVARLRGLHLVNWCQDLFPEVAGALDMTWAGRWPGRLLKSLRNSSLRQAAFNAVIHQKMAERLIEEGISPAKVRVLENWADAGIKSVPHEQNPLREAWGLKDRFVIGYSGNLGRAHMPARIAELVNASRHIPDLTWLFIGGGAGLAEVKAATQGATNVQFRPYQPRDALSQSLSAPDMHLVTLDPGCEGYIVPSKLYGVRAAHRPALFLGDIDGATARDIARLQGGEVLNIRAPQTWGPRLAGLVDAWRAGQASHPGQAWSSEWSSRRAVDSWTRALGEVQPRAAAEAANEKAAAS